MSIGIHFMPRGNLAGVFSYVLIFGFVTTLVAQEPIAIDYPMVRWTFPIPVRGVVNDGTWNDSPSISGDGLTMYWESAREIADLNLGELEFCCIWSASRPTPSDPWENAQPLVTDFSHIAGQGGVSDPEISYDGLELFFLRDFFTAENGPGWSTNDELWLATRSSINEPFDVNDAISLSDVMPSTGCVSNPSVTADGLELYFFRNPCGSEGGAEIRVSKRTSRDAPFGESQPALAGTDAHNPSISPDGLQLLHFVPGTGGNVFVSKRNSRDEEFHFDGATINVPGDTLMQGLELSADGKTVYFYQRGGVTPHPDWPFDPGEALWQASVAELCDFNADGVCNGKDLTRRTMFRTDLTVGSQQANAVRVYDISGDGLVDSIDLSVWLDDVAKRNGFANAYLPGDTDLNGKIDFQDFLNMSANFGSSNRDWSHGNFNGDASVDFADFLALSANFGETLLVGEVSAVPEPTGLNLATCAVAFITSLLRPKRGRKGTCALTAKPSSPTFCSCRTTSAEVDLNADGIVDLANHQLWVESETTHIHS